MNRFEQITEWLKDCPVFESNYIYFNSIDDNVDSASITSETNESTSSEFIDGNDSIEMFFNINIIKDYDKGTSTLNLDAIGLFDDIDTWIKEQNENDNLPVFEGCIVNSVKRYYTNPDVYVSQDDTKCRLVARYLLKYITI